MASQTEAQERLDFIEDVGIVLEHMGVARMAGKIFGSLLLSREPEVSTDELIDQLETSRGTISTMTRLLIQLGMVDRVGRSGERRDYFRIKPDTWTRVLKVRMGQIIDFHGMIERALEIVTPEDTGPYNRLREMHEFFGFFENEFADLLDRWEELKKQASKK
jgi:DNA-binding transcriptional regulator GbsR (MarR family)